MLRTRSVSAASRGSPSFKVRITLHHKLNQFDDARKSFERAVMAEPANYDVYIERANESMLRSQTMGEAEKALELRMARVLFETALLCKPDSFEALTGLALASLRQGKTDEGLRLARAAAAAGPEYPAGLFTLAAAQAAVGQSTEAALSVKAAGNLDKPNLEGRQVPTPDMAWRYYSQMGRTPMLSAPK